MPETRGIRTLFRRKIVWGGMPPEIDGKLARWAKEFVRPGAAVTGSRILNRFAMKCELDYRVSLGGQPYKPKDFGILGAGFVGMGTSADAVGIRSIASRRVGEIVASVGESLEWLSKYKLGKEYTLLDRGVLVLQFWRISRNRALELEALEAAGALLKSAGVVKELVTRKPALLGEGTWRGYKLQLPLGVGYDPQVLFLALTVFKLAVAAPDLLLGGLEYAPQQKIKHLLAYFQHLDDDARTAYRGLEGGYPLNSALDVRKLWRIPETEVVQAKDGWRPGFIHPTAEAVRGVYTGQYVWGLPVITIPRHPSKTRWMPGLMPQNNEWLDLISACGDLWVDATKIAASELMMLTATGLDKDLIQQLSGFLGRKTSLFAPREGEMRMNPRLWDGIPPQKIRKALLMVPGIAAKPEDIKTAKSPDPKQPQTLGLFRQLAKQAKRNKLLFRG